MNIPYHEWLRDGPDDATATGFARSMVPIPTAPHTMPQERRALTDKEQSQRLNSVRLVCRPGVFA